MISPLPLILLFILLLLQIVDHTLSTLTFMATNTIGTIIIIAIGATIGTKITTTKATFTIIFVPLRLQMMHNI